MDANIGAVRAEMSAMLDTELAAKLGDESSEELAAELGDESSDELVDELDMCRVECQVG